MSTYAAYNNYGEGNGLECPDDVPFSPLPNPLTPRLLAVREQAIADMAADDEERAKAAWIAYCGRNGMDPAAMPERYLAAWQWAWSLRPPEGANCDG